MPAGIHQRHSGADTKAALKMRTSFSFRSDLNPEAMIRAVNGPSIDWIGGTNET
jgi:hypothetical protein